MLEIPYDASALPQKYVAVIDGTPAHRQQAVAALQSTYRVLDFANTAQALCELDGLSVALVIVDEAVGPHPCEQFIRLVKALPRFETTPTLVVYRDRHVNAARDAEDLGAEAFLTKPYRSADLYRTVVFLINQFVEREWETLPQTQQVVLRKSLGVFRSISDAVESGREIPYSLLVEACAPLVDSVKRNDFKGVLGGLRNHDNYTYAHCLRVATYMTLVGYTIGLRDRDLYLIAGSGLMHDVGKLTIPHGILNKPGRFDPEEWEIMKGHVTASGRCLARHESMPKVILDVAEQHHERIDGSGYPRGLAGRDLHEVTRIATIADVFGALTDRRPYKKSMAVPEALTMMTDMMPGHFDKTLFTIFIQSLIQTESIAEHAVSAAMALAR